MPTSYIGRTDLPRGLRNNNPGNIREGDAWQGLIGTDPQGFIVFKDTSWGLRALATDLTNKINRGVDTIRKIVNVYAPASDNNDVPSYIAAVSADTGNGPDDPLGLDTQTVHDLVRGIMNHELGPSYSAMISDSDINNGIAMMNNSLLSLFQATGIATETAITNLTGGTPAGVQTSNTPILIGLGLVGLVWWIFSRKN